MRTLMRHLTRSVRRLAGLIRRRPRPRPDPMIYRSASCLPLRPWQVRGRRFGTVRRGLDPAEVDAFLERVADDLAELYAQIGRSRDETIRIKRALRDWQSRQAPTMHDLARR